jgi:peptidoglycan/LPS O-acetylase OafA/YrhL
MIHRSNGFDGLRLTAATLVIIGHAFPLTGHVVPGLFANGVHSIGVKIFFVISGYLITRSWQSDPDFLRFWLKRALRIWPGLISICLFTIVAAGLFLTDLSPGDYFRNPGAGFYLWNIALYPVYQLPGVFRDNVFPSAVNGSLWSLPVEVAMYCGVPTLVGRYRRSARILIPATAATLFVASIYFVHFAPPEKHPIFWGTSLVAALDVAYYFYAGATLAILRADQYCHPIVAAALFIASGWFFRGAVSSETALALTLPYLIVSIGKLRLGFLNPLQGHDLSYGLYLYGFPVQQTVIHFSGPQSAGFNACVSLTIAAVFAALSWRCVERPALRLKPQKTQLKHEVAANPPAVVASGE